MGDSLKRVRERERRGGGKSRENMRGREKERKREGGKERSERERKSEIEKNGDGANMMKGPEGAG